MAPSANTSEPLSRDAFGFRKVIVAVTPRGKIYGIDSANGEILWSRVFGLGWAAEVGGNIIPVKIFVTRTVNDGDAPQVVVVTQRQASNVSMSINDWKISTQIDKYLRVSWIRSSSTSMRSQVKMSEKQRRTTACFKGLTS